MKNNVISIVAGNGLLVSVLEEVLKKYSVEACKVDSTAEAPGPQIWVGMHGSLPDSFGIPEANIFYTPVRLGTILDRIQQIQAQPAVREQINIGPYSLDETTLSLKRNGTMIRLTEKETEILKILVHANGRVVKKEDMLRGVWGYAENVETHTLETHIYRLRQKIEEDPASPKILLTQGAGYRLT